MYITRGLRVTLVTLLRLVYNRFTIIKLSENISLKNKPIIQDE